MADPNKQAERVANTVLGPVPLTDLGVIVPHEALLSVLPGAQYAFDITIDRAEILDILAEKLTAFKQAGGGTIVDATGMFHGRDLSLLEALSRATGVHIIASTGMGPEELLGGYFLTPQTNPPTPWAAERFAGLFTQEVTEGMAVSRRERRAAAGLIVTAAAHAGMTPTENSLFRGAAQTALDTGLAVSLRTSASTIDDLRVVLDEGLTPDRIVVANLDRREAVEAGYPAQVAELGATVAIDHVGVNDDDAFLTDAERVSLIRDLIDAGHVERIILSVNAVGVGKGVETVNTPYGHVIESFVPQLQAAGVTSDDIAQIVEVNPRELVAVRATTAEVR